MRKRVFGIYTYVENEWAMDGSRRYSLRRWGVRPFYIVSKPPRVGGMDPKKVQAVIDAAREHTKCYVPGESGWNPGFAKLGKAVRALDGK